MAVERQKRGTAEIFERFPSTRISRTEGFASSPPIPQKKKNAHEGRLLFLAEREGFTRAIPGPRPSGGFAVLIGNPTAMGGGSAETAGAGFGLPINRTR